MYCSRSWSYTAHVTDHALITWLSCTEYVAEHALFTWLITHLSRIPFFRRFPFRSEKAVKNFAIFCKIAALMNLGNHRNAQGLKEILALREILNQGKGRTRKYSAA